MGGRRTCDRRARRADRHGVLLCHPRGDAASRRVPLAFVFSAGRRPADRLALPAARHAPDGHERRAARYPRADIHSRLDRAAHFYRHDDHAPVRRQRRTRGRGAAARRRARLSAGKGAPARREGHTPYRHVRHEQRVLCAIRLAAHGGGICDGGRKRRHPPLFRHFAVPHRVAHGGIPCERSRRGGGDVPARRGGAVYVGERRYGRRCRGGVRGAEHRLLHRAAAGRKGARQEHPKQLSARIPRRQRRCSAVACARHEGL